MKMHVTDMKRFRDCRQSWLFGSVYKLRPNVNPSALTVGSLFHHGIEVFHKIFSARGDIPYSFGVALGSMTDEADEMRESEHYNRSASAIDRNQFADDVDLAAAMLENFSLWYGRYELIHAEMPVRYNIPTLKGTSSQGIVVGTSDGLVKYRDMLWALEAKTSISRVTGDSVELKIDFQQQAYVLGMRKAGYPVVGALRLIAVKKLPKMPKVTQKGKLSRAKITTTYEHVMRAIELNELSVHDYEEWLDELMVAEHPCFQLYEFRMTDKQLELFERELYRTYMQIRQYKKGMYRNESMWCRRCSYQKLCHDQAVGNDWLWRAQEYFHESDRG